MQTRRSMMALSGSLTIWAEGALSGQISASASPARSMTMAMEIKRSGSAPSRKGPADWFTGTVRIDPLFAAPEPARANGGMVTFEPGARTAWHTHPLGQTLLIILGLGWVQCEGGPARRRGVVSSWLEALARRVTDERHEPHRHSGIPRRQECRLARKGQRRAISQIVCGAVDRHGGGI